MHVGHLHVNDEKMSKSLGNFVTVDEALVRYHPEVIKFFLLKTQYRQPFNYTEEGVIEAQTVLLNFYLAMWSFPEKPHDEKHPLWQSFMSALSDDLNVAKAISIMHQAANATVEGSEKENSAALLRAMGGVLGVLQETPAVFLQEGHDKEIIESKIQQRQRARAEKDFATADSLRAELQDMGVVTEDIPNGTRWYRKLAGLRSS
jgi:cysteinyl-tRNA synthetase